MFDGGSNLLEALFRAVVEFGLGLALHWNRRPQLEGYAAHSNLWANARVEQRQNAKNRSEGCGAAIHTGLQYSEETSRLFISLQHIPLERTRTEKETQLRLTYLQALPQLLTERGTLGGGGVWGRRGEAEDILTCSMLTGTLAEG